MATETPCDLAIDARWVAAVVPFGQVLDCHSVIVDGGRIVDVIATADVEHRWQPVERVVRDQHLVIPGFVNARTQAATTLFRGLADDLRTGAPQRRRVSTLDRRWASAEMVVPPAGDCRDAGRWHDLFWRCLPVSGCLRECRVGTGRALRCRPAV
ncbi:MAG: hypothetical protein AAFZ58_11255 [Pseudomonadota bacterium]